MLHRFLGSTLYERHPSFLNEIENIKKDGKKIIENDSKELDELKSREIPYFINLLKDKNAEDLLLIKNQVERKYQDEIEDTKRWLEGQKQDYLEVRKLYDVKRQTSQRDIRIQSINESSSSPFDKEIAIEREKKLSEDSLSFLEDKYSLFATNLDSRLKFRISFYTEIRDTKIKLLEEALSNYGISLSKKEDVSLPVKPEKLSLPPIESTPFEGKPSLSTLILDDLKNNLPSKIAVGVVTTLIISWILGKKGGR